MRKNRFDEWLKDRDCLRILVKQGLCGIDIDNNLKEISKRIEDLKLDLYNSMFRKKEFDKTRKMLNSVRDKQTNMIGIRHMLDHLTLKGFAEMTRRQFLLFETLYYYNDGDKVWDEWDNIDSELMELAVSESVNNIIPIDTIREISRTDPWKSIWGVSNGTPFNISPGQMNDEQRAVIMFSSMYDNVAKHPECPPDDVLDDDDLFDGWMIKERRKREKEQMNKQVDDRLGGRHGNSDEVYLVAPNKKEANKIHEMNDMRARVVKAQREKQLEARGKMRDSQFSDRKIQIQQEANQQFIQQVKGKK